MTISGFFKFANDLNILSDKESGLNRTVGKDTGIGTGTGFNFYNNKNKNSNTNINNNFNYNDDYNCSSNKERVLNLLKKGTVKLLKDKNNQEKENKENKDNKENNQKLQVTEIDYNSNNENYNSNNNNINLTKIPKSEISLIFHNLSGVKNFDISNRIKSQFDKNKGYNTNFENSFKGKSLESKNLNNADNELKPLKMNFILFMKSFELISSKIYKEFNIEEALYIFIDNNIQNILKSKKTSLSLKKYYEEKIGDLRREDIVHINNKSFNFIKFFHI